MYALRSGSRICLALATALVLTYAGGALGAAPRDDEQYALAAGHYAEKRWDLAALEFQEYLQQFPQSNRVAEARYYLGECHIQLAEYAEAIGDLRQFLDAYPEHALAGRALFRVGEAAYLDGQLDAARDDLQRFSR